MQYAVLRTSAEFQELRSAWQRIYAGNRAENYYLSFDWFSFLIRHDPGHDRELAIMTATVDAEVVAIIPCSLVRRRRLCFWRHRSLELIGNIYSPYRGGLVTNGMETEVARGFVDFLSSGGCGGWEMLNFENLSANDPFTAALLATLAERDRYFSVEDQFVNLVSDLSAFSGAEAFFRSFKRKFRDSIKRRMSMLNRAGGFDIFLVDSAQQDIDRFMDDYYDIYSRSWKPEEGDRLFHRELAKELAGQGLLRLFLLYLPDRPGSEAAEVASPTFATCQRPVPPNRPHPAQGIPAASAFFVVHGKRAYFLKTAYREGYDKYGLGILLLLFSFNHLLDVDHVEAVDHQKGAEEYKKTFGGVLHESRMQLLAGNPTTPLARFDLRCRENLVPLFRRIKTTVRSALRTNKRTRGSES